MEDTHAFDERLPVSDDVTPVLPVDSSGSSYGELLDDADKVCRDENGKLVSFLSRGKLSTRRGATLNPTFTVIPSCRNDILFPFSPCWFSGYTFEVDVLLR